MPSAVTTCEPRLSARPRSPRTRVTTISRSFRKPGEARLRRRPASSSGNASIPDRVASRCGAGPSRARRCRRGGARRSPRVAAPGPGAEPDRGLADLADRTCATGSNLRSPSTASPRSSIRSGRSAIASNDVDQVAPDRVLPRRGDDRHPLEPRGRDPRDEVLDRRRGRRPRGRRRPPSTPRGTGSAASAAATDAIVSHGPESAATARSRSAAPRLAPRSTRTGGAPSSSRSRRPRRRPCPRGRAGGSAARHLVRGERGERGSAEEQRPVAAADVIRGAVRGPEDGVAERAPGLSPPRGARAPPRTSDLR